MAPADDVMELADERFKPDWNSIVRIRILAVPDSEKFPDGVKYRLHYGTVGGDTIVRYDNSHGVHERHTADGLDDDYEFPGYSKVQTRFRWEVDVLGP